MQYFSTTEEITFPNSTANFDSASVHIIHNLIHQLTECMLPFEKPGKEHHLSMHHSHSLQLHWHVINHVYIT